MITSKIFDSEEELNGWYEDGKPSLISIETFMGYGMRTPPYKGAEPRSVPVNKIRVWYHTLEN